MPSTLISLDEASWRLEQSTISGQICAELLLKSEPLLFGLSPGNELHDRLDLSRVTSFRAEAENVVIADNVRWTEIKLNWSELGDALERRGVRVSWCWYADITPELLERSRQRRSGRLMPSAPVAPRSARRARPEWFEGAVFTGAIPPSGKPPRGKRGPKSGKRGMTAAAIRKDLDKSLTVIALRTKPEKELAARYGVSRDTARKAKYDVLQSTVGISISTFDK